MDWAATAAGSPKEVVVADQLRELAGSMNSAPIGPARQSWAPNAPARTARPRLPDGVGTATTVLLLLAGLGLIWSVLALAGGVVAIADGESPGLVLALGGGLVALDSLYVLLAVKTRRGHRWAWLTTLVLLGLVALLALGVLVLGITTDGAPEVLAFGLVFLVPTGLLLLLLTGPRSSREYFRRR
jgi:peptidoglycan/LPS O-acetylase OafA/YrhL